MSSRPTRIVRFAAVVTAVIALRLAYAHHCNLAYDEYQHMHIVYLVAQGQTPFVDFFAHHTPLFHYFAAAVLPLRAPTFDSMITARCLSLAFHGLTIIAAGLWARAIAGGAAALTVAALLAGNVCFFIWGTRTYTDTYAAPLLVLAAWMLSTRVGQPLRYAVAGVCLGLAVLTSQKAVFAGLAALAVVALRGLRDRHVAAQRHALYIDLAAAVAGAAVALMVLFALLGTGGVEAMLRDAVFLNLHWKARHFPRHELAMLFASDAFIYVVAGIGVVTRLWTLGQRRGAFDQRDVPVLFLVALGSGVLLLPVVWEEYFILLLPFAVMVAGLTLELWWRGAAGAHRAVVLLFVATAMLDLVGLRLAPNPISLPACAAVLALWCAAAVGIRYAADHNAALRWLALVLVLPVVQQVDWIGRHSNIDERARVDYVMANTQPTDPIFDGRSGFGVFRPHAYRYWFLHDEMQLMLSDTEKSSALIDALERQRVKIALVDEHARMLPRPVLDYIAAHYADTPYPDIKRRMEE